jgi:putative ABC transport system ATP-binding protein
MIKTEKLTKLFATEEVQTKALNEVTLQVEQGEFVAIMGPSGCGKSTLLNILGTLDSPTSGSYFFEGKQVDKMNENQLTALRKGNLGFIFQSFNLIDELTVCENVELPLIYIGVKANERKESTRESKPAASCQPLSTAIVRWTATARSYCSCRSDGL